MKRIVTIQDISCVGKCSLTVALPIISATGVEAAIIPTAVLSTHTMFKNFTCKDLDDQILPIAEHWKNEGITFDAFYTGYLASAQQIAKVIKLIDDLKTEGNLVIIDPAMADNGKLYPAFDGAYVEAMKELAFSADIILPNITEACFLTGTEYRERYDEAYITQLLDRLTAAGAKTIVLTGVGYREGRTGVVVQEGGARSYYEHRRIAKGSHGTGDVYAAAFVGALLNGKNAYDAAVVAADYTLLCIEATQGDAAHWYGVKFEAELPAFLRMLGK